MRTYIAFLFQISLPVFLLGQKNHFGIIAGYNNATAKYEMQSNIMSISGLQAGTYMMVDLKKNFYFTGNLVYNQKGNWIYVASPDVSKRSTIKMNFLDLVTRIDYRVFNKKGFSIFTGIGGYLGCGLFGKEYGEAETIVGFKPFEQKIKFSNKNIDNLYGYAKRMELGWTMNATFKYRKCLLYTNYSTAFTDRNLQTMWEHKVKNRVFTIGIGYQIK